MRRHRLERLAKLTQGAAVLSLGSALASGCQEPVHVNSQGPETRTDGGAPAQAPPVVNAPVATSQAVASASSTPAPSSNPSAIATPQPSPVPHTINAPPQPIIPKK